MNDARHIAQINLFKVAAPSAYYAAFHAAEALIVERTGKSVKTHRGVRIEFARLTKDVIPPSQVLAAFLTQSYQYKVLSDYSTDRTVTVSYADAEAVITQASDFVQWVEDLLGAPRKTFSRLPVRRRNTARQPANDPMPSGHVPPRARRAPYPFARACGSAS